jgi:hypothetical protein
MPSFWSEQVETEIETPLPSRLETGSESRWSDLCTRTIVQGGLDQPGITQPNSVYPCALRFAIVIS